MQLGNGSGRLWLRGKLGRSRMKRLQQRVGERTGFWVDKTPPSERFRLECLTLHDLAKITIRVSQRPVGVVEIYDSPSLRSLIGAQSFASSLQHAALLELPQDQDLVGLIQGTGLGDETAETDLFLHTVSSYAAERTGRLLRVPKRDLGAKLCQCPCDFLVISAGTDSYEVLRTCIDLGVTATVASVHVQSLDILSRERLYMFMCDHGYVPFDQGDCTFFLMED